MKMENSKSTDVIQTLTPVDGFLEQLFWAFSYLLLVELGFKSIMPIVFKAIMPKTWKKLGRMPSATCSDGQAECLFSFSIGLQHVFAGTLIAVGAYQGKPYLVQHGILCETGWELLDATCLVLGVGPYAGDKIKKEIKRVFIFHHIPGIISGLPIIVSGLHATTSVQIISASMILVGGIGVITQAVAKMLACAKMTKLMTAIEIVETAVFMGARFYLFPLECYRLVAGIYDSSPGIATVCIIGFLNLSFFNVVIARLKLTKLFRTLRDLSTPAGRRRILLERQSSSTSWIGAGVLEIQTEMPVLSEEAEHEE